MTIKQILCVTEEMGLFYDDSSNGHHHIRSLKHIPINSVLHTFTAKEYVDNPTYLSVQVDEDKHILLSPEFLQYINHSCEPNTFFNTQTWEVVAIRDIKENEEITFFYPSTEWEITQPFECFCQTESCLGKIQGASQLNNTVINKYRLAEHIKKKLLR
jgi:hypothetical protein